MAIKITYIRPDGGLSVVVAVEKAVLERDLARSLSNEDYVALVVDKSVPADAQQVTLRAPDWEPPVDRTFRNAWEHQGAAVGVNMPKARDIWRDKMRVARAPLLEELDTAYMRADEAGNAADKRSIATQKQALRDVTEDPAIETAKTPEELKQVWPTALGTPLPRSTPTSITM